MKNIHPCTKGFDPPTPTPANPTPPANIWHLRQRLDTPSDGRVTPFIKSDGRVTSFIKPDGPVTPFIKHAQYLPRTILKLKSRLKWYACAIFAAYHFEVKIQNQMIRNAKIFTVYDGKIQSRIIRELVSHYIWKAHISVKNTAGFKGNISQQYQNCW